MIESVDDHFDVSIIEGLVFDIHGAFPHVVS